MNVLWLIGETHATASPDHKNMIINRDNQLWQSNFRIITEGIPAFMEYDHTQYGCKFGMEDPVVHVYTQVVKLFVETILELENASEERNIGNIRRAVEDFSEFLKKFPNLHKSYFNGTCKKEIDNILSVVVCKGCLAAIKVMIGLIKRHPIFTSLNNGKFAGLDIENFQNLYSNKNAAVSDRSKEKVIKTALELDHSVVRDIREITFRYWAGEVIKMLRNALPNQSVAVVVGKNHVTSLEAGVGSSKGAKYEFNFNRVYESNEAFSSGSYRYASTQGNTSRNNKEQVNSSLPLVIARNHSFFKESTANLPGEKMFTNKTMNISN